MHCIHQCPKINEDTRTKETEAAIQAVKLWVYSWFFYVESHPEYEKSKSLFSTWLTQMEADGVLDKGVVQVVRNWVTKNLEPSEQLWLNYIRLNVQGMNQRTTSPGEPKRNSFCFCSAFLGIYLLVILKFYIQLPK